LGPLGAVNAERQVTLLMLRAEVVENHSVGTKALLDDAIGARVILVALRGVSEETIGFGTLVWEFFRLLLLLLGAGRWRLCPWPLRALSLRRDARRQNTLGENLILEGASFAFSAFSLLRVNSSLFGSFSNLLKNIFLYFGFWIVRADFNYIFASNSCNLVKLSNFVLFLINFFLYSYLNCPSFYAEDIFHNFTGFNHLKPCCRGEICKVKQLIFI
jgi:hypothetical protein